MSKNRKRILTGIAILALSLLAACGGANNDANPRQLSLVTGGTGGTYYPLGGQIAEIIKDATDIETTAQVSNASAENMQTMNDGEADIGFTQTDIASYAKEGKLMFEGSVIDTVQAIGTLYPETIQIVTLADSGIETVEDLKGKKVSVGAPGSGTFANAEQILEIHGITLKDINALHLAFDESVEGIQDGNIAAAFITAGTPTGSVESLSAIKGVNIIGITDEKADALIKKYPYYAKDVIKAGTYKLEADVTTVAVQAMLVARSNLSESLVYDITKALFENTDKITHAKGAYISAESALDGIGIELHPGAAKYFKEKGLE
ncbi:TAXI family TRAP transporter solute-binding subunit [Paenibacillus harenae]|uniref:TAXI family TRAP transporter solute-binding subunit n=1 Tax=Paenibacillus harenae TaxID=306543 RepID=UPI0027942C71|nr:TAXI family TRAP transporter solute-binding subunit [Paenibacillus harenae]MDQ0060481.1 TRAP transporter TAXI family solute receptor [Paenibacillus harenae]